MLLRHSEKVPAEFCQNILISSNHILAGSHCLQHILPGRMDSPHQLNDNLNILILQDFLDLIRQMDIFKIFPFFMRITNKHRLNLKLCADFFCNLMSILFQHPGHSAADRAKTQQTDLYLFFHPTHLLPVVYACPKTSRRLTPSTMRSLSSSASRSTARFTVSMETVALATPCSGIP